MFRDARPHKDCIPQLLSVPPVHSICHAPTLQLPHNDEQIGQLAARRPQNVDSATVVWRLLTKRTFDMVAPARGIIWWTKVNIGSDSEKSPGKIRNSQSPPYTQAKTKTKSVLPLPSRNISIVSDLGGQDAQMNLRGDKLLMDNDKSKLSFAKFKDKAEELILQRGKYTYEITRQGQTSVAVLMDEEAERNKREFVIVEGEAPEDVAGELWPAHLSDG
ncbi:hypothetical protein BST61_g1013 [Cercospora zeina]